MLNTLDVIGAGILPPHLDENDVDARIHLPLRVKLPQPLHLPHHARQSQAAAQESEVGNEGAPWGRSKR